MKYNVNLTAIGFACSVLLAASNAAALSTFADTQTRRAMETLHTNANPGERANAVRRLSRLCNSFAYDAIKGARNDKAQTVRYAAQQALPTFESYCHVKR